MVRKLMPSMTAMLLVVTVIASLEGCSETGIPHGRTQLSSQKVAELFRAVEASDVKAVRNLLAGGVDPNAKIGASNAVSLAVLLLEDDTLYSSRVDIDVRRAQEMDMRAARDEVVRLLIDGGGDIETVCQHGDTPLLVALHNQRSELATWLIDRKASVNVHSRDRRNLGWTPLHLAWYSTRPLVQKLVDHGGSVNATNVDGASPLMVAVQNRKMDVIVTLLENGANLNYRDPQGDTPLSWAAREGDRGVAELLRRIAEASQPKAAPGS